MVVNPAQQRRPKMVSEQEKQEERNKHKNFEKHKKQVTFFPPKNEVNSRVYDGPLD